MKNKKEFTLKDALNGAMKDPEFKNEYEKLEPRYRIAGELIKARKNAGLSQEALAKIIGTKGSNISRLESGNYNPTLEMICKIAEALGKKVEINLV